MGIFDILSIVGGLLLIVAPTWAYNFGNSSGREMPKNWPIISRIAGVVFIALGVVFLILGQR